MHSNLLFPFKTVHYVDYSNAFDYADYAYYVKPAFDSDDYIDYLMYNLMISNNFINNLFNFTI